MSDNVAHPVQPSDELGDAAVARTSVALGRTIEETLALWPRFVKAATEEYAVTISSSGAPATVAEFRELRLYLLIKHVFEGAIPDDWQVKNLFRLTTSAARTLLSATIDHYGPDIRSNLVAAMTATLEKVYTTRENEEVGHDADWDKGIIPGVSPLMLRELNRLLWDDPSLQPLRKVPGTQASYRIGREEYVHMKERLAPAAEERQ